MKSKEQGLYMQGLQEMNETDCGVTLYTTKMNS